MSPETIEIIEDYLTDQIDSLTNSAWQEYYAWDYYMKPTYKKSFRSIMNERRKFKKALREINVLIEKGTINDTCRETLHTS